MRRFLDQPLWVRVLRGILLAGVVALVATYIPTPFLLEAPGRAVVASNIITIKHQGVHPVNGRFLMTTVLIEKASVMMCIYGLLDPSATLTRRQSEGEQAQSPSAPEQMELSQYLSSWVALETLGYTVQGDFRGLRVVRLVNKSPNANQLRKGDLILEAANKKLASLEDFTKLLQARTTQDKLKTVLQRDGKSISLDLALAEIDGKLRIGALLQPEYTNIKMPVDIGFRSGTTTGASAGLVFALEIYDRLDPGDLARGRAIAATGTLDRRGRVGGIEGLPFKLIAAERAGADVFLVPRENYGEVKNISTEVTVIPVSTFEEALDALQ
jgi:PDZ domain-containing protein